VSTAQRLVALLLSLVALVVSSPAFATTCEVPQLKTSTERADVIFVGVVAAETPMGGGMGIYRMRVDRVFKGSVPATVTVSGGGMKGSTFIVGEHYLVFGRVPEPNAARPPDLFAHLCGGTETAARATEWLIALGTGSAPTGTTVVAGSPPDVPAAPPSAPAPAAASSDPPAEPQPRTEPTAPVPSAHTTATTTATTPANSGGCAGCSSSGAKSPAPLSLAGIAFAISLLIRQRGRLARCRSTPMT
jgi:hypothetical protein